MNLKKSLALYSLCVASVGLGWADDSEEKEMPFTRLSPTEEQLVGEEKAYFGIFILGKKVGWVVEDVGLREFEGKKAYSLKFDFMQKLLNDGEPMTMESHDVEYYSAEPPYEMLFSRTMSKQNGFESSTEVRRKEDGTYEAKIISGRSERVKDLGKLDITYADRLTPGAWCENEPKVGDTIYVRELSLGELKVTKTSYKLAEIFADGAENAPKADGLTARYRLDYFDLEEKTRIDMSADRKGRMLTGKISGAMDLRRMPEKEAKELEANIDLFAETMIKVDRKLGDPTKLREMVLEIKGPGIQSITDSANQDATYDEKSKRLLLKIGRSHGIKQAVTEEARAKALEETSLYPIDDAEVKMLAEEAVKTAERPRARIKRLVDFVDTFIIDDYGNEPLSVIDIIETQRGDCTEHSQLFVTMARSLGIPAREVSGFIYGEGAEASFGGHAWCEVEVEGFWHPVDPTWGETVVNATHIRISGEKPSSEEMELYMGGLEFRILSTKDRRGRVRTYAEPSE